MQYVRELEAWSVPGQLLHPEYSKCVLQQELWDAGIPRDVFLGLSAIPDATDCENLKLSIRAGELAEDLFIEFCVAHHLPASLQSQESSAKYLEYMRGRCLAWIHLPEAANGSLLLTIVKMLRERGHVVIDPETMAQIENGLSSK